MLEALLQNFGFDFIRVTQEFNTVAKVELKKIDIKFQEFEVNEIRTMWAYIEERKLRPYFTDLREKEKKLNEKNIQREKEALNAPIPIPSNPLY